MRGLFHSLFERRHRRFGSDVQLFALANAWLVGRLYLRVHVTAGPQTDTHITTDSFVA